MTSEINPATRAVRASLESDTQHGAVVPPIHLSSTFTFAGYGAKREYDYTRSGNPTRDSLARAMCDLEQGAGAVVTGSDYPRVRDQALTAVSRKHGETGRCALRPTGNGPQCGPSFFRERD